VRNGGFPLACGRWCPDGHDAIVTESLLTRRCRRCEKAEVTEREPQRVKLRIPNTYPAGA
jgi:hypothetical protein